MKNYIGIIIEESLENKEVLDEIKITKTVIEKVTPEHETPWLKQWTIHTVLIPENKAKEIAEKLSKELDRSWYADFKNHDKHYIIFKNKVFHINKIKSEYIRVIKYGISLGIPDYLLNFALDIK
jgi:hypothetical protein